MSGVHTGIGIHMKGKGEKSNHWHQNHNKGENRNDRVRFHGIFGFESEGDGHAILNIF